MQSISNVSKAELITRRMTAVSATSCNCAKAEAGTYVIEVSYYRPDISSYMKETVAITVTDSTAEVVATVDRTTSTEVCKTALELAKNCISVKNGEIKFFKKGDKLFCEDSQSGECVCVSEGIISNILFDFLSNVR